MTSAPERIWADNYSGKTGEGYWRNEPLAFLNGGTQYVRADTIAALRARLAEVEAERDARIEPEHVQAMLNDACPVLAEAIRAQDAELRDAITRAEAAEAALATAPGDALREAAIEMKTLLELNSEFILANVVADAILALIDKKAAK